MKRRLTIFLSVLFGIILVCIWIYIVDLEEMIEMFKSANISLLLPIGILFVLMYFLRSLRWKIILSPIERITSFASFKLCMISYFVNFLVPIHAGELAKCLLLKKMKGTSASKSLLTAYVDKLAELAPVFLLLIITPFLDPEVNSVIYLLSSILFVVFLLVIFSLIAMVYKKETAFNLMDKVLFFMPSKFRTKLRSFFSLFVEAVTSLPQLSNKIVEIVGLTLLAIILHCLMLWLFFYMFGVSLPVITVFAGYLLFTASFILPAPPGFSGSLELTALFIFSYLFGYDKNIVSVVTASSHVVTAFFFGVLGILSIALIGTSLTSLFKLESDGDMSLKEIKAGD